MKESLQPMLQGAGMKDRSVWWRMEGTSDSQGFSDGQFESS